MLMQWTPSTVNQLSHCWITYWSLLLTTILLLTLHCCRLISQQGHHQVCMYRYFNVSLFQLCYVFKTHIRGPPTNGAPVGHATYQQKQQVIIELTMHCDVVVITIIDAHFNSSTGWKRRNDTNCDCKSNAW